jgi:hypothetical protein
MGCICEEFGNGAVSGGSANGRLAAPECSKHGISNKELTQIHCLAEFARVSPSNFNALWDLCVAHLSYTDYVKTAVGVIREFLSGGRDRESIKGGSFIDKAVAVELFREEIQN